MGITPLYFGDSDRKLYGVFHHPVKRWPAAPAVLLFNPFGEEAIRSNRIFRQIAERLSRAGAPVLRFDYYGSGDSAGDCAEMDFDGMARDAATAHDELEAMTGARRFSWIGLGLGAAVAMRAAVEISPKPTQLILWDPVLRGVDYLSDLRRAHIDSLSNALDFSTARIERDTPKSPMDLDSAMGFVLSEAMRTQLLEFEYRGGEKLAREIFLVSAASTADVECFKTSAAQVDQYKDASIAWNSNEAMNAHYIPVDVIDYIADAIGGPS